MKKMDDESLTRLLNEYNELAARVIKLQAAIRKFRNGEDKFIDLDSIHLLEEQLKHMEGYRRILKICLYQQGIEL